MEPKQGKKADPNMAVINTVWKFAEVSRWGEIPLVDIWLRTLATAYNNNKTLPAAVNHQLSWLFLICLINRIIETKFNSDEDYLLNNKTWPTFVSGPPNSSECWAIIQRCRILQQSRPECTHTKPHTFHRWRRFTVGLLQVLFSAELTSWNDKIISGLLTEPKHLPI